LRGKREGKRERSASNNFSTKKKEKGKGTEADIDPFGAMGGKKKGKKRRGEDKRVQANFHEIDYPTGEGKKEKVGGDQQQLSSDYHKKGERWKGEEKRRKEGFFQSVSGDHALWP